MVSNPEGHGLIEAFERLGFWSSFMPHAVFAMVGSCVIGFIPEGFMSSYYVNTAVEPYSPTIFAVALLLGTVINAKVGHRSAMFVWIAGVLWLAYGMYSESDLWQTTRAVSRLAFIRDSFFGTGTSCSDSECLHELFVTTPSAASVGYSIGAALGYVIYRRKEKTWLRS